MSRGVCGYCGEDNATTGDHVVPKCLFLKPRPAEMVVIPACTRCQNEKAAFDHVLRDTVFADTRLEHHPRRKEMIGKVQRAYAANRSTSLTPESFESASEILIKSPGGIILQVAVGVPLPEDAGLQTLKWIVRGLWFKKWKTVLDPSIDFDAKTYLPEDYPHFRELSERFPQAKWHGIGDDFRVLPIRANENPDVSLWFLIFHGQVPFTVVTGLPSDESALAPQ